MGGGGGGGGGIKGRMPHPSAWLNLSFNNITFFMGKNQLFTCKSILLSSV